MQYAVKRGKPEGLTVTRQQVKHFPITSPVPGGESALRGETSALGLIISASDAGRGFY